MTAFDEAGGLIESVQFPFEQVEPLPSYEDAIAVIAERLGIQPLTLSRWLSRRSQSDETVALQTALEWISQKVPKSDNGVIIRANVACWHYLKAWRPMTLTALAAQIGRDKQAVGRWEDDFKLTLAKGHWRQRP